MQFKFHWFQSVIRVTQLMHCLHTNTKNLLFPHAINSPKNETHMYTETSSAENTCMHIDFTQNLTEQAMFQSNL